MASIIDVGDGLPASQHPKVIGGTAADAKIEEEIDDCPIEEVRMTVPITDDSSIPCLTFRTWVLGLISCAFLSFVNQFFGYRQNQVSISSVCVQILALPVGKLMAATLPEKEIVVPFTNWSFSLNPGPFNLKEHVLITILANSGAGSVYGLHIVTIVKAFYHRSINAAAALLLAHTTQLLGYGWAGLFRKYLVESPYMWWPSTLVQVSLFSALHEDTKRPKGGLSRFQFFLIVLAASFAYYVVPNFFFPSITALSFVCWIWKRSVTAQQIGSGLGGLGLGSVGLDWTTVSGFLGSPLATPAFAIFNTMAGYLLFVYIVTPIGYWTNSFGAKTFPILSSKVFDSTGRVYNITRIVDEKTFSLDIPAYEDYSKINLSIIFAYAYGLSFATLTATISHVLLFNGSTILKLWRQTRATTGEKSLGDVHARIMKRNYESVPQWWFHVILVIVLGLSFLTCEGFNKQLQLPYWGILLASAMAFFFTLPIGIIAATTNQVPGLNVITELVIGYLYPGKPLANVAFKTYGYISMTQALTFVSDFKLGHYMKIPPKAMFAVQMVGTLVASSVYFGTAWWLLTSVEGICDSSKLSPGSPWTCPNDEVFYDASIIWGVVGPLRMFGRLGLYQKLNYFFLIGLLAPLPVYLLSRAYPDKLWIKMINFPVILSATASLPPAKPVNYNMWIVVGVTFNWWVYKRYKAWWARHNYVLSAGLDAGTAFMAILAFFALGYFNINSVDWWGGVQDDHCPLARCRTAPSGYTPEGCPAFQ